MHSGDPSSSPAGDTLAVSPVAADYSSNIHLDRGDVLVSASSAASNDNNLGLEHGDDSGTADHLGSDLRSDTVNVGSEIGELLEGGLGDAERIGAELAELSAELGLLAGLADSDHLHDLFDVPRLKQRGSTSSRSSSSSTTWSGARGRVPPRAQRSARPARRRTIAKLKEGGRRRGCGATGSARRAVEAARGWRAADAATDDSDVGADSDSDDDWWTECSSESSSVKEGGVANYDCGGYDNKLQEAEAPPMGQFLLPLLSSDSAAPIDAPFLIRHEDILQLLASAEESARADPPIAEDDNEAAGDAQLGGESAEIDIRAVSLVTPEEEAKVLRYVCEAERQLRDEWTFPAVEDRLLAAYHTWCETSALMYTLLGTAGVGIDFDNWLYRGTTSCHCRLCVCRAHGSSEMARHVSRVVIALARGERTMRDALLLMEALCLRRPGAPLQPNLWELPRPLGLSTDGETIVEQCMRRLHDECALSREMALQGCLCRPRDHSLPPLTPVEAFVDMLERFKATSYATFQFEMLSPDGSRSEQLESAARRLAVQLRPYQRSSVAHRLRSLAADLADDPQQPEVWSECDCQNPPVLNTSERKRKISLQHCKASMYCLKEVVSSVGVQFGFSPAAVDQSEQAAGGGTRDEDICAGPPDAFEVPSEDAAAIKVADVSEGTPHETGEAVNGTIETCNEAAGEAFSEAVGIADGAVGDQDTAVGAPDGTVVDPVGAVGAVDEAEPVEVVGEEAFSDPEWEAGSSSSLDSAERLLVAAAAAVESAGGGSDASPATLCHTVRRLCKSIASIEVLMDRVLKHCGTSCTTELDHCSARVKLEEVDRKLMAMYRWLPEMHHKQLQVYRRQKKLSHVCMQLVGGRAPPPPPPGSPPPAPPASPPRTSPASRTRCRAVCPEYHLRRFKEVKRKVLHMRDQQLYYHRLRHWLAEQLKRPDAAIGGDRVLDDSFLRRRLRRAPSPRVRRATAAKRRPTLLRPHRILHMLRRASADGKEEGGTSLAAGGLEPAVNSPGDGLSDTDTIVDKGEELCMEMKDCVSRFAKFGIDAPDLTLNATPIAQENYDNLNTYPDSISPPLHDLSPTCSEPLPVYRASAKSNHRLVAVNKLLNRSANMLDRLKEDICADFDKNPPLAPPDLLEFIPPTTRRMPLLVEEIKTDITVEKKEQIEEKVENPVEVNTQDYEAHAHALIEQVGGLKLTPEEKKDPQVHKYVEFGLEIKRAIEECQNIINSCNSYIKVSGNGEALIPDLTVKTEDEKIEPVDNKDEGALSFEQIYEAIMSLEKNSTDILECMDRNAEAEPIDANVTDTKLAALVESMPQILANMPEIATKLSEFANVSFELPEFASMLNSLPEVNNEAQLTPETLKQIRELKISKARDGVKVTKHTAKRKAGRRIKSNSDNDIIGTITFDIDSKDISDMIRDEKELQAHLKNKNCSKEDFRDLLLSVSAQVVTSKVYECIKQNSNPENAKYFDENNENIAKMREFLEGFEVKGDVCHPSKFFENSVKVAYSMQEFRELVESRFHSWKNYLSTKFIHIPQQTLEEGMDTMLNNFYWYIEELAEKQNLSDSDKIPEKLDQEKDKGQAKNEVISLPFDETCKLHHNSSKTRPCECHQNKPSELESLKQIMKFIKDSVGSTFDIILMQTSKMPKEHKNSVKRLKFKYMDVIRRCGESGELASWILLNPEVASTVILDMTSLPPKQIVAAPDFTNYTPEKRLEYFMQQLREMNRNYMKSLPKDTMSGDDWLVTLFRLEQLENKLKEALMKTAQSNTKPAQTQTQNNVSETREAELLAGKGLSKIINQANKVKKPNPAVNNIKKTESPKVPEKSLTPTDSIQLHKQSATTCNTLISAAPSNAEAQPNVEEPKASTKPDGVKNNERNGALLAKCEAILTSKGDKSLLDSFYTIKSYITSGQAVPETYKKHVIKICSSIDAKLLDPEVEHAIATSTPLLSEENTAHKNEADIKQLGKIPNLATNPIESLTKPPERCVRRETKSTSDEIDSGSSSPQTCCTTKGKHFAIIGSQNPELLAKYSAQALRNAKQSLNAVAFNSIRSSKPDADTVQKSDCKWTSDCACSTCEGNVAPSESDPKVNVELGKPLPRVAVNQVKVPVSAQPKGQPVKAPAKPALPKVCENIHPQGHQQHVCKMGHTTNAIGCANEANHHQSVSTSDQPCTCCYCTVFGHAPPMTTPVPRNFNETRERLRSILNRKKQKGTVKPTPAAAATPAPVAAAVAPVERQDACDGQRPQLPEAGNSPAPQVKPQPAAAVKQPAVKVPAKGPQSQNFLAEQMAKMILSGDGQDAKKDIPQPKIGAEKAVPPATAPPPRVTSRPLSPRSPPYPPRPLSKDEEALEKRILQEYNQMQQTQLHKVLLQKQQQQQQLLQQQQQQQQQIQQQQQTRQARPQQQQRDRSYSSRDTSVFSTSSGCSAVSGWRDGCVSDDGYVRVEDTRDLDALLQYIEGPARHVDRGKKKAKKQRQKAKKVESRLIEEHAELQALVQQARRTAHERRAECAAAKKRYAEARAVLEQQRTKGKKKAGKKSKPGVNPQLQQLAEEHGQVFGAAQQALRAVESELAEAETRLASVESELREVREVQTGRSETRRPPQQHQQQQHQQQQHQQQQHQQQQHQQQQHQQQQQQTAPMQQRAQRQAPPEHTFVQVQQQDNRMVRIRRSPGDGAVTVTIPNRQSETPLMTLMHASPDINVYAAPPPPPPPPPAAPAKEATKKQSWEAALAHITALATQPPVKTKEKSKKQQKESVQRPEQMRHANKHSAEQTRANSLTEQTLSKKQRKLLAKQQAEQEELIRKQLEAAKSKKSDKKGEPANKKGELANKKGEPARKADAIKADAKKAKEEPKKQDVKKDKQEKKGKENKTVNNVTTTKQQPKPAATQPAGKKGKQQKQQQQVYNITPDTIQLINNKGMCVDDSPSCSIMEQLSCGVQVADLRLPPGITLTRVPPSQAIPPPAIKSVPLWKSGSLPAAPTPPARPQPVINADPSVHSHSIMEPTFGVSIPKPPPPEPTQPVGKSKKAKKKAKKAAAEAAQPKTTAHPTIDKKDGTKMVTLRNPMFHPNLPPVQVSSQPSKKLPEQIRIPDPIPMPPSSCQATITPTSNGMYTIRNPLMSMVHQQSLMGMTGPGANPNAHLMSQGAPAFANAYVVNQGHYPMPPQPPAQPQFHVEPQMSPKKHYEERQPDYRQGAGQNPNARIMNLASFTQKNDEGYSLFNPPQEDGQPAYGYDTYVRPKPMVSPNPIGTRPEPRYTEPEPFKRPEPIGTPLRREEEPPAYGAPGGLYTPFGSEERDFRAALFQSSDERKDDRSASNGDTLPYFQRLRAGARLNNEVTIHHVTESKFFKPTAQEQPGGIPPQETSESLFRTPYSAKSWTSGLVTTSPSNSSSSMSSGVEGAQYQQFPRGVQQSGSVYESVSNSSECSPQTNHDNVYGRIEPAPEESLYRAPPGEQEESAFGAIGRSAAPIGSQRLANGMRSANSFYPETSVFAPDRSLELSSLDSSERDIESFKRFDYYFEPPKHKPKIALNLHDIAAQLKPKDK